MNHGWKLVVFTDLDGTLLDRDTFRFDAAMPALERLRKLGASVVLVSSKTKEEVEVWRQELNNNDPFSVENGGAVFAEHGMPRLPGPGIEIRDRYEVAEFGVPYRNVLRALADAAGESKCRVRSFSSMTPEELSRCCGIDIAHARMARNRRYDEPFELLKGDPLLLEFAIRRRGFKVVRNGRFLHISGGHDKADAVLLLVEAYRRMGTVRTIGLGDGLNDAGFLNLVEHPVILESPAMFEVHRNVPRARIFPSGPRGWNAAIFELLGLSWLR